MSYSEDFKRLGITRKKSTLLREQKPAQVEEYLRQTDDIHPNSIAYVDETGIDTCLYRDYDWPERGKPLVGTISGRNSNGQALWPLK